jgi:acyl transferase domain-containing protein
LSFLERMREEGALDHTAIAQPAIFALQTGLAALWRSWGIEPEAVVGHSVGEIAAAWACGALSLEEGVRVAAVRGQAMEAAHGKGKMAAVELSEEEARPVLQGYEGRLCIAAVNSPSSTVLAGEARALEEVAARLKEQGVTCRMLRVELAFHSPQMEPCDQEVAEALSDLRPRPARLPMISTVTGGAIEGTDLNGVYWGRNVREPVRFAAAVEALAGVGERGVFLEIGPHPVLSVAMTQTLERVGREAAVFAVFASLRRGRDERETLLEALGGLWVLGLSVDWAGVHPDGGRPVRLPSYPFQRQRYWFEVERNEGHPEGESRAGRIWAGETSALPDPSARPSLQDDSPGGEGPVERLLAEQLDAFNRMVALQLDVLGRTGSI